MKTSNQRVTVIPRNAVTRDLLLLFSFFLFFALPSPSFAQVQTGTPAFGSIVGGPDAINLANLNVQLTIPVRHKPGRGTDFIYDITYDSSVWYPVGGTWRPINPTWGWKGIVPSGALYVIYSMTYSSGNCGQMGQSHYQIWGFSNFTYYDEFGVSHAMNVNGGSYGISPGGSCPPNGPNPATTPWTGTANDGSGLKLYINPGAGAVSLAVDSIR